MICLFHQNRETTDDFTSGASGVPLLDWDACQNFVPVFPSLLNKGGWVHCPQQGLSFKALHAQSQFKPIPLIQLISKAFSMKYVDIIQLHSQLSFMGEDYVKNVFVLGAIYLSSDFNLSILRKKGSRKKSELK